MRLLSALALLLLVACSDDGASPSGDGSAGAAGSPLQSGYHQEDPEDAYCGDDCEPYSVRSCNLSNGGTAAQVCDPQGLRWSECGDSSWEQRPSQCAKGTKCTHRSPTGNFGCRAICEAKGSQGCSGGLERVECQAPTPNRAKDAKCEDGDGENVYCCPSGSAILNPP